jgi:hypothetical protein
MVILNVLHLSDVVAFAEVTKRTDPIQRIQTKFSYISLLRRLNAASSHLRNEDQADMQP